MATSATKRRYCTPRSAPAARRPHELALLHPLGEQAKARAVPGQNLHIVAALAPEHEGRARIRIGAQRLRDLGGEAIEAAPHVDGLQGQIDFHPRRELKHQRPPSADRTRRSASASTSASDTHAPFGSLISITPRRPLLRVSRTGFVEANASGGAGAGAVTAFNSTSFTGTNAGAPPSCVLRRPETSFRPVRARHRRRPGKGEDRPRQYHLQRNDIHLAEDEDGRGMRPVRAAMARHESIAPN
jgi:hypothetical protein